VCTVSVGFSCAAAGMTSAPAMTSDATSPRERRVETDRIVASVFFILSPSAGMTRIRFVGLATIASQLSWSTP
jgi:hypothetical protein